MGNSTSRSQVWQYKVEPSLKCRIKDSFVQWQIKGPDGPLSYGMRLKTSESAQKVTFPPLLLASARMYVSHPGHALRHPCATVFTCTLYAIVFGRLDGGLS